MQTGKKNILRLNTLLTVVLIIALVSQPAFAGGMAVFDMNAFTNGIKSIKNQQEQIEYLTKQVETLGGIKTTSDQISRDVRGHYYRGQSMISDLKRLKKKFDSKPTSLQGHALKWLDLADGGLEIGEDGFVSAAAILNQNFIDPRDHKRHRDALRSLDARYQVRQVTLADTILKSDEMLRGMPTRIKKIEEISSQIDGTENLKDAMDLNNRFLAECLTVLSELLAVNSHIGQTVAMLTYKGASDKAMQERRDLLDNPRVIPATQLEQELAAKGFDPKTATYEDYNRLATDF